MTLAFVVVAISIMLLLLLLSLLFMVLVLNEAFPFSVSFFTGLDFLLPMATLPSTVALTNVVSGKSHFNPQKGEFVMLVSMSSFNYYLSSWLG